LSNFNKSLDQKAFNPVGSLKVQKDIAVTGGNQSCPPGAPSCAPSLATVSQVQDIVARELLRGEGLRTVSYLGELADIANRAGDQSSAVTWQELADAAEPIVHLVQGSAGMEAFDKRTSFRTKPSW
jgi:hypothetical protein